MKQQIIDFLKTKNCVLHKIEVTHVEYVETISIFVVLCVYYRDLNKSNIELAESEELQLSDSNETKLFESFKERF